MIQPASDLEYAFRAAIAKMKLKQKGWSLRTSAPFLGVHFGHLHKCLQADRESRSLLKAVESLPHRGTKKRVSVHYIANAQP